MTKRYLVVASNRHNRARLLKYYPRPPCAPSFDKSRMLRPLQTHFLLFQQILFIVTCVHPANPRVPQRQKTLDYVLVCTSIDQHHPVSPLPHYLLCEKYHQTNHGQRWTPHDNIFEVKVEVIWQNWNPERSRRIHFSDHMIPSAIWFKDYQNCTSS